MIDNSEYEIYLPEIWGYCRNEYLAGNLTDSVAKKIIDNIQEIIVKEAMPVFGIEYYDSGSKDQKTYYNRNANDYIESLKSLERQYYLEHFFSNLDCYEYDNPIVIDKSNSNFNYWFSLKLLQYEGNIQEIPNFLEFNLKTNFDNNKIEFSNFLKLLIRQFEVELLSNRIVETVKDFIAGLDKFTYRNTVKTQTKNTNIRSFTLTDSSLVKRSNGQFSLLLKELKDRGFVNEQTKIINFISVFQNKAIDAKNRIHWTGTNIELQLFIKLLEETKKITSLKNDIWLVTIKCFINRNREDFTLNQLRTANGNKERKQHLEAIVLKF